MPDRRVIVIGAGMGGLAAAIDLARQDVAVTLIERHDVVGGRMHQRRVDGVPIDSGPTVITMRWVFEDLFDAAGLDLGRFVDLRALPVIARHAWSADERLDLFADHRQSVDAIARFSSPAEARRFEAFCAEAARVYRTLEGAYIRSQRPSLLSMGADLGLRGLTQLAGLGPFASLWKTLGRHFHDPRLRQLFARYATYCGGSPWQSPATLMLIAHVEQSGVWAAAGGMQALGEGVAHAARTLGVNIRCSESVEEIVVDRSRATGVRLASGETLDADAVIFNGEAAALQDGLLGKAAQVASPARNAIEPRSLSALTWAMHARTSGFEPSFHTVFFQDHYDSEFSDIFEHARLPRRPTVYMCAQDRSPHAANPGEETSGSKGLERLLLLVNAPALGRAPTLSTEDIDACQRAAFNHLARCGLTLEAAPEHVWRNTPAHFSQRFAGSNGAIYGMAPHGWMSSFRRAASQTAIPGLYLAGGSVHPGAGVPMAALSGRLAAATLMAHLDSTSRSRRVVISGGMSTG
jgi:1-hydroxycarotenoid 3,4-desaturase